MVLVKEFSCIDLSMSLGSQGSKVIGLGSGYRWGVLGDDGTVNILKIKPILSSNMGYNYMLKDCVNTVQCTGIEVFLGSKVLCALF